MSTKTLVVFKIWILENGDITWKRSIYAAIWIQITVQTVDMLGGNLVVSPCVYPLMYAGKIRGMLKISGSRNGKWVFPGKKWFNTSLKPNESTLDDSNNSYEHVHAAATS